MQLKEILTEGKYENITTLTSRYIINSLKSSIPIISKYQEVIRDIPPIQIGGDRIPVVLYIQILDSINKIKAASSGAFVRSNSNSNFKEIRIFIYINESDRTNIKNLLSIITPAVKQAIRHELEHYDQFFQRDEVVTATQRRLADLRNRIVRYKGNKVKIIAFGSVVVFKDATGKINRKPNIEFMDNVEDNVYNYLLSGIEIEAFVVSIYKMAKIKKIPFSKYLWTWLEPSDNSKLNKLSDSDRRIIHRTYMMYAIKRFPNIK